jgi:hypothetical protein
MRKRSKYRPKGSNPTAHLMAIQGAAKLDINDVLKFVAPLDAAVEAARQGKANKEHWQSVFNAINLIEELIRRKVAQDEDGAIEAMQQAVIDALDRLKQTGSKTLKAQEINALLDLLGVYTDLLSGITHSELFEAELGVQRRLIRVLSEGPRKGDVVMKVTGDRYERKDD